MRVERRPANWGFNLPPHSIPNPNNGSHLSPDTLHHQMFLNHTGKDPFYLISPSCPNLRVSHPNGPLSHRNGKLDFGALATLLPANLPLHPSVPDFFCIWQFGKKYLLKYLLTIIWVGYAIEFDSLPLKLFLICIPSIFHLHSRNIPEGVCGIADTRLHETSVEHLQTVH